MTERTPSKKHSFKEKALRTGGAATIAAAFYGAGIATKLQFFDSHDKQPSLAQAATEQQVLTTAQHEIIAQELAVKQAADYTKAINEGLKAPRHSIPMKILNGTVETIGTSKDDVASRPIPIYENPIVLTVFDETRKPDSRGEFLEGGWIGIKDNDSQGRVVIRAVPFYTDLNANTFVPNDPASIVISVNAYAATNKGGPGYRFYDLYAADTVNNQPLHNPDGSALRPGLTVG